MTRISSRCSASIYQYRMLRPRYGGYPMSVTADVSQNRCGPAECRLAVDNQSGWNSMRKEAGETSRLLECSNRARRVVKACVSNAA